VDGIGAERQVSGPDVARAQVRPLPSRADILDELEMMAGLRDGPSRYPERRDLEFRTLEADDLLDERADPVLRLDELEAEEIAVERDGTVEVGDRP
jgi:hypothetical protein